MCMKGVYVSAVDCEDFSENCFMYKGEIYTKTDVTDDEVIDDLVNIYISNNTPEFQVKVLQTILHHLSSKIKNKYCE